MQCRVRTPQADGCSGLHRGDVAHQRGEHPQLCFNCVCSWGPHGETSVRNISSQTVNFHCTHTCMHMRPHCQKCYFYLNFIKLLSEFKCKYEGKILCLLWLLDLLIFIYSDIPGWNALKNKPVFVRFHSFSQHLMMCRHWRDKVMRSLKYFAIFALQPEFRIVFILFLKASKFFTGNGSALRTGQFTPASPSSSAELWAECAFILRKLHGHHWKRCHLKGSIHLKKKKRNNGNGC